MPTNLPSSAFDSISDAIKAFEAGSFIVVLDSPSRENEGDLIISATALTTSKCAFMLHHTSGYVCAPMPASRALALALPPQVSPSQNRDPNATAYTVSVDADHSSISTGISAHDRALTCRLLGTKGARKEGFRRPGHILPLVAREGGVRERMGHTEAAVEFCRLSGRGDVGVICELVEGGEEVDGVPERSGAGMMRGKRCVEFARKWGLKIVTIEALREFVEQQEVNEGDEKASNGVSL
ncbi:MAG: hypothetical protein M4579_002793 [Chaenotheca gracillima]|nr:MAG: hypothetical protein M4579_002793 [Chaenotheca gracillima]